MPKDRIDFIKELIINQDKDSILEKIRYLQKTDGEGWAIGETLKRILEDEEEKESKEEREADRYVMRTYGMEKHEAGGWVKYEDFAESRERNQVLQELLDEMIASVIWMSGSKDFFPGGEAYVGWLKVRRKLEKALRISFKL